MYDAAVAHTVLLCAVVLGLESQLTLSTQQGTCLRQAHCVKLLLHCP
jgi:hypothetical protein